MLMCGLFQYIVNLMLYCITFVMRNKIRSFFPTLSIFENYTFKNNFIMFMKSTKNFKPSVHYGVYLVQINFFLIVN